jgi:2-polyprenyl-3-methyl-5-hydroxy-6-metoxy-1,4-benzoquinol methylase
MDNQRICPLCKSEHNSAFERIKSFGFALIYYQCSNCGLVFQSAAESQASGPTFYEETYRKVYQSSEAPTPKDIKIQQQRALNQVRRLKQFGVKDVRRALDVGASTGVLLDTIGSSFNAQTVGIEPGRVYRQFAEAKGLEMVASLEDLLEAKPERFDLISLMHVLEHLADPLETLIILRESLLTEEGYLLIEVPNFYAHDSYELAHLTCFTPHSLREMVRQAGYQVVREEKHGFPRSKILKLYLTILAKPVGDTPTLQSVKPESLVRLKRSTGMFYRKIMQKVVPGLVWLPTEPQAR